MNYLILGLYALLILCMGGATIIEKVKGSDFAHETIYGSWWFIALWTVLTMVSLAVLLRKGMHRKLAVFLLHVSFAVILAGALVTHLTAENGVAHLRVGEKVAMFMDDDNRVHHLPFVMTLTDFRITNYPGTDAVMDYHCDIDVTKEGRTEKMNISMNNIGKADGYRFYQTAYDYDARGTQLLVAHDPYGIAITYTGYVMLLISLLWTMGSKHTRIRQLYHIATRPVMLIALLCLGSAGAQGQESRQAVTEIAKETAHEFGKVVVLYNNRLCPANTAAQEFVTKLSGKPSWNGYSADEIFLGWITCSSEWEEQKIIRIKSEEVQRMLGIEGAWASVNDFYTNDDAYKLTGKTNDATLPDATRKAIREADEKIQVISMLYNNEMVRLFPLPSDTPAKERRFMNHAMDELGKCVKAHDMTAARAVVERIKVFQREMAGDVMPSETMIGIEITYNSMMSARWVTFLCLTLSILFCLLLLSNKGGKVTRRLSLGYIVLLTAYLSILFVMRWFISGHVPMSNGYETMLFMAWITLVITIPVMHRIQVMQAFGPLVSAFCMLVSTLAVGSPKITSLMPVLQSPLLSIHVAVIMVAYALLALITLISIQCLIGSAVSRKRGEDNVGMERATALSLLLLYPAITTLAIGIFIGAVWANVSWGSYWSWDPKETWALITLMIYAVPVHRSFMPAKVTFYHLYILFAFLTVLMTYFGVNYFLSGMHSYSS